MLNGYYHAIQTWGEDIPGAADGTYNVHEGHHVVIALGTKSIRLVQKEGVVRTEFRPFAFAFGKSESFVTLLMMFVAVRHVLSVRLDCVLRFRVFSSDGAECFPNSIKVGVFLIQS